MSRLSQLKYQHQVLANFLPVRRCPDPWLLACILAEQKGEPRAAIRPDDLGGTSLTLMICTPAVMPGIDVGSEGLGLRDLLYLLPSSLFLPFGSMIMRHAFQHPKAIVDSREPLHLLMCVMRIVLSAE